MNQDQYILWVWHEFIDFGNERCRNYLLDHYLYLVKFTAERVFVLFSNKAVPGHSVTLDDLIHAGIFGLIDAINEFKAEEGSKFETYAKPLIRKSILNELSLMDWLPRSVYEQSLKLSEARDSLFGDRGTKLIDQQKERLKYLISKGLTRPEKLIIFLYYYEEMTMKEIGELLDLSESRVSEIRASLIARIRDAMSPDRCA